jgi:hypothetical protein
MASRLTTSMWPMNPWRYSRSRCELSGGRKGQGDRHRDGEAWYEDESQRHCPCHPPSRACAGLCQPLAAVSALGAPKIRQLYEICHLLSCFMLTCPHWSLLPSRDRPQRRPPRPVTSRSPWGLDDHGDPPPPLHGQDGGLPGPLPRLRLVSAEFQERWTGVGRVNRGPFWWRRWVGRCRSPPAHAEVVGAYSRASENAHPQPPQHPESASENTTAPPSRRPTANANNGNAPPGGRCCMKRC